MSASVTQTAAPVKVEMTAPVTQSAAPGACWCLLVQFALPRRVPVTSAPEPLDARVQRREVVPVQMAALRGLSFGSQPNGEEHFTKPNAALRTADLACTGNP